MVSSMTDAPPPQQQPPSAPSLSDLILSLDHAAFMAKQLQKTIDPTHLHQIYSSLHQAHHHLSSFFSNTQFTVALPPSSLATENSLSSAATGDDNEPMQVGDEDKVEVEENSKPSAIDMVEERLRECFIKNKRPKRPLSPSSVAVADEKRLYDDGFGGVAEVFDPHGSKLRALDLVYQFHA